MAEGSARGDGKEGNKKERPHPSPLSLPFTAYLSLILIGDRVTTGDESGSGEQFLLKVDIIIIIIIYTYIALFS